MTATTMPHTLVMTSNPIAINAIPATMRKSLPARLCMNETKEPMICVLLYFFLRPYEERLALGDWQKHRRVLDQHWSHLPDQLVLSGEAQEVLRAAINELPVGLRAAFVLRDLEGLSTAECAHIQELTEVTCKVRLHRARLRLREQLSTYFSERSRTPTEETR